MKQSIKKQRWWRYTEFNKSKGLRLLMIVFIVMITCISVPNLFFSNVSSETKDSVKLKDISCQITGAYNIISASNTNLTLDVSGGVKFNNRTEICVYSRHTKANQKFIFNAVDANSTSYIYMITPYYTASHVFDIDSASATAGAKLQLYENNSTIAQKFVVKEVYELVDGEYKYVGYVILTASSNYKLALTIDKNNKIVQENFDYDKINKKQVWYLNKVFSGYSYKEGGYLDSKKYTGYFNVINYGNWGNHNDGFYYDSGYWECMEEFLTIKNSSNWNFSKARITSNGYTFFDSATLKVAIDNALSCTFALVGSVHVDYDNSTNVNGKNIGSKVGKGRVEIEYIDENGKSYSTFNNNVFSRNTSQLYYTNNNGNNTFNKVGRYVLRVYYKVKCMQTIYVCKELEFAIGSSTTTASAIKAGEEDKTLSSYTLSLNKDNNIKIVYDGDLEYKANDQDLIEYLTNSTYETETVKQEKIQELKERIKKYKEYKIYFTNTAFYMSSANNNFVQIVETIIGHNTSTSSVYYNKTNMHPTDGIYEYETLNIYKFGEKNYYQVYVQCQPNKQVFRNVTYCYKNENDELINYAIDYAFLEDLKIFPYTMTTSITYQNISNENANLKEIPYKSNSIIYNTTNDVLKLKFVVKDISGNKTTLYLYIYPAIAPRLNEENLKSLSYKYNYITTGYSLKLYNSEAKEYQNYLFSSKDVAIENLLSNVITNEDVCIKNEDGSYTLTFDPNGSGKVLNFESNDLLVEYLYNYYESNASYITISPEQFEEYNIPEEVMHFETLYLDKDYIFTSDEIFPLFESYKVYFEYYSLDGELFKEGIITYNGDYKYGETMYKILADEKEENWKDGYVSFTEYNISANQGNSFTAYIVNSNSKVELKTKQGTKRTSKYYNSDTSIMCEEFTLCNSINEDVTVVVEHNGKSEIYNYYTIKNIKYNEIGNYTITVSNTHGFKYSIQILVDGLDSYVDGVSNYGITYGDVTFRTDTLNFDYYINGKKQSNTNYSEFKNGEYIFTFKKSTVDTNVYIVKNYMQFAFVIKGSEQVSLNAYYSLEDEYLDVKQVRAYKEQVEANIEIVDSYITQTQNLVDTYNSGLITTFTASDVQTRKYDTYLNTLKQLNATITEINNYVEYYKKIDNELLKINENYKDIDKLEDLVNSLKNIVSKEEQSFKLYAVEYFLNQKIDISSSYLSEQLIGKSEFEIQNLYNEYTESKNAYKEIETQIDSIRKEVQNLINSSESFENELNYIQTNFQSTSLVQKGYELVKDIVNLENTYYETLTNYRNELNSVELLHETNPFVKYNIIDALNNEKVSLINLISENYNINYEDLYLQIKQVIFSDITSKYDQANETLTAIQNSYNTKIQEIEKCEEEKAWWKIFKNSKLNDQIDALKEEIVKLYTDNSEMYNSLINDSREIIRIINLINSSKENLIDAEVIQKIEDTIELADNIFENLK